MSVKHIIALLSVYVLDVVICDKFNVTIRMPNVVSDKADALLCHAIKLDPEEAYITKFEPLASKSVAHHMMLYGCEDPATTEPFWPCGEKEEDGDIYHRTCKHGSARILYAWALDAELRTLPSGTGFRVGGTTGINYLIVGMHYKEKFKEGQTDNSGYHLQMTHERLPYQIGYYILGTYGTIPPMTREFHADTGCNYMDDETIYPLAYRTHSHNLGVVTSAYRLRDERFTEIGRMSPQRPETFYDITTPGMNITKGDVLIGRCTYSSQRNFTTKIGSTNKDEMCNFYIMYYTSRQKDIRDDQMCFRDHNSFSLEKYLPTLPEKISSIEGIPPFERIDPYANQ